LAQIASAASRPLPIAAFSAVAHVSAMARRRGRRGGSGAPSGGLQRTDANALEIVGRVRFQRPPSLSPDRRSASSLPAHLAPRRGEAPVPAWASQEQHPNIVPDEIRDEGGSQQHIISEETDLEPASCTQLKNCKALELFFVEQAEAARLKAEVARLKAEAKDSRKRVEKRRRKLEACGLLDRTASGAPHHKRRRRPLVLAVAPAAKRACRTPARSSSVKTERLWGKSSRMPIGFRPRSPTRARSPSRALSAASALSARHRSVSGNRLFKHLPAPPTPETCPGTPDLLRSGSIARTISPTPAFSRGRGVSPTPAPLRNVPSAARQPGESADSLPFDCFRWETHEGQPALIFDISDVTPAAVHRLMEFGVAVGQIVHVDFNKENVRDRGQWIDKTCFFKIPTGATLEKAAGLQVGVMGGNEKTRPRAIGVAMAIVVALEDSSWQKENEARVATTLGHDGFPDFVDHASGSKSKAALSPAQEQFRRLSPPPRRVSPPPLRGQGHKTEEAQMSNAAAANAALPLMLRPAPAHRNQEGRVVLLGRGAVRGRGAQPVGSARGQPSRGAALNGRGNSKG